MRTKRQTPIREDKQERIEVHVAGICLRPNDQGFEVLLAKRRKNRDLYPGKWECGGGQVRPGENFETALRRQFFEEMGLKIQVVQPVRAYEIIRHPASLIPGIVFLCLPEGDGHDKIEMNHREFSECRWQSVGKIDELDLISGIKHDIELCLSVLTRLADSQHSADTSRKKRIGFGSNKEPAAS